MFLTFIFSSLKRKHIPSSSLQTPPFTQSTLFLVIEAHKLHTLPTLLHESQLTSGLSLKLAFLKVFTDQKKKQDTEDGSG